MDAQPAQSTAAGSFKLLMLVLRHLMAPFVSLVVSYVTVIGGLFVVAFLGQFGFMALCAVVGFCGVFVGARFLPPASRSIGSVGLLLLGLIYFYNFVATWGYQINDEGRPINVDDAWRMRLVFLALGGGAATLMTWWLSSKESRHPMQMEA